MRSSVLTLFFLLIFACIGKSSTHYDTLSGLANNSTLRSDESRSLYDEFSSLRSNGSLEKAQIKFDQFLLAYSNSFSALTAYCSYLKQYKTEFIQEGFTDFESHSRFCDAYIADSKCVAKFNDVEKTQLQILIKIKQNASYSHLCPAYLHQISISNEECLHAYGNYSDILGEYSSYESLLC